MNYFGEVSVRTVYMAEHIVGAIIAIVLQMGLAESNENTGKLTCLFKKKLPSME